MSAGTVNSPKLLQHSGIGPGDRLASLGLPIVHHNPNVGAHMRDHWGAGFVHALRGSRGYNHSYRGVGLAASLARYALTRGGPLARGPFDVGLFARSSGAVTRPDIQIYLAPHSLAPAARSGRYRTVAEATPGLTASGCILHATSESRIELTSPDPDMAPAIRTNWLSTNEDCNSVIGMLRYLLAFLAQEPLAGYIGNGRVPPDRLKSDEQLLDYARHAGRTNNHRRRNVPHGDNQEWRCRP